MIFSFKSLSLGDYTVECDNDDDHYLDFAGFCNCGASHTANPLYEGLDCFCFYNDVGDDGNVGDQPAINQIHSNFEFNLIYISKIM